jgi:demethylmenaquinone methyltransferase/2-methoxy-6-polyprenyl-1,4-benzoquinol methylase
MKNTYQNQFKKEYVKDLFNNLAKNYDLLNNLITFGRHKFVKKQAINNLKLQLEKSSPNAEIYNILDVCCGTGDISILLSEKFGQSSKITAVDFSENMLQLFKEKTKNYKNISCLQADAMNLPFNDETFDAVFISFGLRNLENYKEGISELKRVTKKNGFMVNLDTGKPKGICGFFGKLFFSFVVPTLGKIFHGKAEPYKYLGNSREDFPSQQELVKMLEDAGFSPVKNYDFMFGMISQQIAKK